MAIVINEFEIVTEPIPPFGGQSPPATDGRDAPPPAPQALRPEDIVLILLRQQRRLDRVRAD